MAGYLEIPKYKIRKKQIWYGENNNLHGCVKPHVRLAKVIRIQNHNNDYEDGKSCKVQTLPIRQNNVYKKGEEKIQNTCLTAWVSLWTNNHYGVAIDM